MGTRKDSVHLRTSISTFRDHKSTQVKRIHFPVVKVPKGTIIILKLLAKLNNYEKVYKRRCGSIKALNTRGVDNSEDLHHHPTLRIITIKEAGVAQLRQEC